MGALPTGFHIGDAICHQSVTRGCICPQGRIQHHRGHLVRVLHSQGTSQGRAALVAPHMHPLDTHVVEHMGNGTHPSGVVLRVAGQRIRFAMAWQIQRQDRVLFTDGQHGRFIQTR